MKEAILTPPAIYRLARQHCPVKARWGRLLRPGAPEWGPGHEIGHALLSGRVERAVASYGLCAPALCNCAGETCNVVELAAMVISAKLHLAADRQDLIAQEIRATNSYAAIDTPWHWGRAAHLLARRRLVRLPRTVDGLTRLLTRRLST